MKALFRVVLLFPFSILFALVVELRRAFFTLVLTPKRLQAFVISVGNLTSGGTGKTPFVLALVAELQKHNKKIAVVCRSYRAQAQAPQRVDLSKNEASYYGDEASLIAQKLPDVPVYVGSSKLHTCLEVEKEISPDVIIIDDGFQHIKLYRDVDIVLIDVTEPRWHYLPLPSGYGRDALWQLDRAKIIVLTKENLAEESQKNFARSLVSAHSNVVGMNYSIDGFRHIDSGQEILPTILENKKVLLVSGIGRPMTFENLMRSISGLEVLGHIIFRDHHPYSNVDIERIKKEKIMLGAEYVITTEKDAVKISALKSDVDFIEMKLKPSVQGLDRAVLEILNSNKVDSKKDNRG